MSSSQELHIRIMPRRDSRESPGRHCDWSHCSDGHEERMIAHTKRIYSHRCPCGSRRTYGHCCLERLNQEELELRRRRKRAKR